MGSYMCKQIHNFQQKWQSDLYAEPCKIWTTMHQTLSFTVLILRMILKKHCEYKGISAKTSLVMKYFVGAKFTLYLVNILRLDPKYDPF